MLRTQFAIVAVATALLSVWAGFACFNLFGPLYRIERFVEEFPRGPWKARCSLRESDKLQDFARSLNEALNPLTARLESQLGLLRELREALDGSGSAEELIARVDAEIEVSARELGGSSADSSDGDSKSLALSTADAQSTPSTT